MSECIPTWQFFAALQSEADPQSIDRSSARDEALDVVLGELLADPAPDGERVRKRYYSLQRNRLSKLHNRRVLERIRFRSTHRRCGGDMGSMLLTRPPRTICDDLACEQLLGLLRTVLLKEEVLLLMDIAEGCSYAEMAHDRKITVSSLKSRAFRIRQKVRNSRILASLLAVALGRAHQ